MSLTAMLMDEACRERLGPQIAERTGVLIQVRMIGEHPPHPLAPPPHSSECIVAMPQELRHTAAMLAECKKEGWTFNFCPFLKVPVRTCWPQRALHLICLPASPSRA